jgi:hypothetical protein
MYHAMHALYASDFCQHRHTNGPPMTNQEGGVRLAISAPGWRHHTTAFHVKIAAAANHVTARSAGGCVECTSAHLIGQAVSEVPNAALAGEATPEDRRRAYCYEAYGAGVSRRSTT